MKHFNLVDLANIAIIIGLIALILGVVNIMTFTGILLIAFGLVSRKYLQKKV